MLHSRPREPEITLFRAHSPGPSAPGLTCHRRPIGKILDTVLLVLPQGTVLLAITHLLPRDEVEWLPTEEVVFVQDHTDWKQKQGGAEKAEDQAGSLWAGRLCFPKNMLDLGTG